MKLLNTVIAAGALVLVAGAASAATQQWDNTFSCSTGGVDPEAQACFGLLEDTNDGIDPDATNDAGNPKVNFNVDYFVGDGFGAEDGSATDQGLWGETTWAFLGKSGGEGSIGGDITYDTGSEPNDWSLGLNDFSAYKYLALVFKQSTDLTIFRYDAPLTQLMGTYSLASLFGSDDLSHLSVYGVRCDDNGDNGCGYIPPIPLPAAGWLMIGGLGGLAALRRRKKA